jgi:hypothetical protein
MVYNSLADWVPFETEMGRSKQRFWSFTVRIIVSVFIALIGSCQAHADTIALDFSVNMLWRYDLFTNAFDPNFQPFPMNIVATVDDQLTGRIFFPPDTTRILFGAVTIDSALSTLVDMGYDLSLFNSTYSQATVQDTFISPSNQGTWTDLYDSSFNSDAIYSKDLQFTADPRLTDPNNFGSADFDALLQSDVGKQYGYREDIVFPGGGYQNYGVATLNRVTISSVPEPESVWLLLSASLIVAIFRIRRKLDTT